MSSSVPSVLVVLAIVMAACASPPTSVRLQVAAAPGLVVETVIVSVTGGRHEVPATDELRLLVPDAWGGEIHRIDLQGTRNGVVVATGAVDVTASTGGEVTATVTLVDASCAATCNVGARRCDGDAVTLCIVASNGCPAWSPATPCAGSTPFCSSGTCAATCADECTNDATTCRDATSVQRCGNFDSDTCLEWSSGTDCAATETCAAGACTAAATLSVITAGSGTGTVTSNPSGITCGSDCSEGFALGTQVTLTALPVTGATFAGWSGADCSGTGPCTVTMTAATTITATFTGACVDECAAGSTMCASASAQRACGHYDSDPCLDWGPASPCGTGELCDVAACTAGYALTVTKDGAGTGTVTSDPAGIACGADCSESYAAGTVVVLSATPQGGGTFAGWTGGGCSGTTSCAVAMSAARTVTATFAMPCTDTCIATRVASPSLVSLPVIVGPRHFGSMTTDHDRVYWTSNLEFNTIYDVPGYSRLLYWNKKGGPIVRLDTGGNGKDDFLTRVAVDSSSVYWAITSPTAEIRRASKTNPIAQILVENEAVVDMAADDAGLLWATDTSIKSRDTAGSVKTLYVYSMQHPVYLTLDSKFVFWKDSAGKVLRGPRAGGTSVLLATDPTSSSSYAGAMAASAAYVYWPDGAALMRCPKAGGAIELVAAGNGHDIDTVSVDGAYVYWSDGDRVHRWSEVSGQPEDIATDPDHGFALDAERMYWESSDGELYALSRCACGF